MGLRPEISLSTLPGEYLGIAPRIQSDSIEIEEIMGNVGTCRIETVNQEEREALVTFLAGTFQHNPSATKDIREAYHVLQ